MKLAITDLTITADLQTTTRGVLDYSPKAPTDHNALSVVESAIVHVTDFSNDWASRLGDVPRLLEQAARRWGDARDIPMRPYIDPVYVTLRPRDGDPEYRAEVYGGRIEWDNQILGAAFLPSGRAEFMIAWERQPYWEASYLQPLVASSQATSATVSGVTVNNGDDSSIGNWIKFHRLQVRGDLPTPVKLQIENTATPALKALFVGHHTSGTPGSYTTIYEGEDGGGTPASASDAQYSGDDYTTISASSSSYSRLLTWTIGGSILDAAGGIYVRPIMRVTSASQDAWCRAKITDSSHNSIYWTGPEVFIDASSSVETLDLGAVQLPPSMWGLSSHADIRLSLFFKHDGSTSSITVDWAQLFPIEGWRNYRMTNTLANGVKIIDDGPENLVYAENASGDQLPGVTASGGPLMLVPGQDNYLWWLLADSADEADADDTISVTAWYRPRRRTL